MPILSTWSDWQAVANDEEWRFTVRAVMETYALTPRQRDVAWGILAGLSNQEIAAGLYIETDTVKNHLTALYERVGVQDRTQLALRLLGVY